MFPLNYKFLRQEKIEGMGQTDKHTDGQRTTLYTAPRDSYIIYFYNIQYWVNIRYVRNVLDIQTDKCHKSRAFPLVKCNQQYNVQFVGDDFGLRLTKVNPNQSINLLTKYSRKSIFAFSFSCRGQRSRSLEIPMTLMFDLYTLNVLTSYCCSAPCFHWIRIFCNFHVSTKSEAPYRWRIYRRTMQQLTCPV